jgi:homoserine O-succinyltransferase
VSRWTEVLGNDIDPASGLEVLMTSADTGLCLVAEKKGNRLYMFNHVEYDSTSLADEYFRDQTAGVPIKLPANYFPHDDPSLLPLNRWRSHAHLLFGNWINQVYQTTPFVLEKIGEEERLEERRVA